ncbi:amino acid/amide ABC transporter membrane protein 1 (HAAT family) [Saccharopolyspora erythraea NRRL 2338]|uniref:ABC transporter permease protein n=2 Tax=Saccharopolyspora erythraea TaxID=1836 RepID=A4FJC4_SACEN|nr:branched-chain amino acid ABC transporter permease [Saccharopolyspora erythraea]EQD85380.1 ABC transporter permease [Saccharopolyspora erythraea D]PFG97818.1 amino acid/amide ABC transporter membrane protein 1 (HAAT family) [Saccharopolyspora erythraea NRRL 2338]QRK87957.1 branched-chain amino acid ABC transporter permease [Saccharopolyspora erythraea]CAM04149.1 ABC transporter permease protein [Saccharopolyspora erythraea NRRL 2338]
MSEIGQYLGNGLTLGAIYALMAVGLTLVFGYMNVVNFAHGEFYMIGAYLSYTVADVLGLSFISGLLAAVLGAIVLGLAIDSGVLRKLREHEDIALPILATIGISILLQNGAMLVWSPVPQTAGSPFSSDSIDLLVARTTPRNIFIVVVVAVTILAAHLLMTRTRIGLDMRATFQDSTASWLMGVNVRRVYAMTFALGAALAALSGVLIATIFQITPTMGALATAKSFVVVILGGLGSFPGAIVGGLLLGLVESLGAGYLSAGYKDAFGLLVLLAVLLLLPQGLFGARKVVQE